MKRTRRAKKGDAGGLPDAADLAELLADWTPAEIDALLAAPDVAALVAQSDADLAELLAADALADLEALTGGADLDGLLAAVNADCSELLASLAGEKESVCVSATAAKGVKRGKAMGRTYRAHRLPAGGRVEKLDVPACRP